MKPTVKVTDRDKGWAAMARRAQEIKDMRVKVGVLADSKGGEAVHGGGLTVAEIAAVMEYGTQDGHIPSRPFLRMTFDAQREPMAAMAGKLLKQVLLGGAMTVERALGVLGAKLAAEVKRTITTGAGVPPPNQPSTIRSKGSSRPLVDTGRMLGAITWAILRGHDSDT